MPCLLVEETAGGGCWGLGPGLESCMPALPAQAQEHRTPAGLPWVPCSALTLPVPPSDVRLPSKEIADTHTCCIPGAPCSAGAVLGEAPRTHFHAAPSLEWLLSV